MLNKKEFEKNYIKNNLMYILLFFFCYQITYANITNINLPEESYLTIDPVSLSYITQDVDIAINQELEGVLDSYSSWHQIKGFTLEEGKKYLEEYAIGKLREKLTDVNKIEKILAIIFSPKHFVDPFASTLPGLDIFIANENEQFKFYESAAYIHNNLSTIIKGLEDGPSESSILDDSRIDPRIFMMDGNKIRKFFFQKEQTKYDRDYNNIKNYYEINNKITNRSFDQYLENVFSNFGIPQDPAERLAYHLGHKISFLSQKMISDIFEAAKRLLAITSLDDNIVFFGNTPYLIGRASQLIIDLDHSQKRNVINLRFSGTPNRVRTNNIPNADDIVTLERLSHFKDRLRRHGLMDGNELIKHKTYFVDIIGSGGGIGYTIETILQELKKQSLDVLPIFEVISLNEFDFIEGDLYQVEIASASERNKDKIDWTFPAEGRPDFIIDCQVNLRQARIASAPGKDGERIQLTFPSKMNPHFTIDCQIVHLPGHTILDSVSDEFPCLRIFPKYNAAYWNLIYDYRLTQEHPTHIKIILDHFDTNVRYLIENIF